MKSAEKPVGAASDQETGTAGNPGGWYRENVEAVVIAVIMALVIRHFCVEAFKIPTSSMEPTLNGNHPEEGIAGDRILVNKFVYRFSEPRRWDVIVFKYPLDKTKNFIKRLVGLPGEELKIWGGNIYSRRGDSQWQVTRKPKDVQEAVWQEIYPTIKAESPGSWTAEGDARFTEEDSGGMLQRGESETGWIQYRGRLCARRSESTPVSEIRLKARAELAGGEMIVLLDLEESRLEFKAAAGEGKASLHVDGKEVASAPLSALSGGSAELEFVHVDGTLSIRAAGSEVVKHEFSPPPYSLEMRPRLRIGVRGAASLNLSSVSIHRDIHYVEDPRGVFRERGSVKIPEDCFVAFGDNCFSSKDSRLWKSIRLRLKNGREIVGEYESEAGDTFIRRESGIDMTDYYGNRWNFKRAEVENFDARWEFAPFIHRDDLIGQAFMVFYPFKRVHLIR